MDPSGFLITFEGVEGCGKTTQARLLLDALAGLGLTVVLTREPGGTRIGDLIRTILLDPQNQQMTPRVELLLYAAARAQHVEEVIRPALSRGATVICDRFADSTVAYQGYGLGVDPMLIQTLNTIATAGLSPGLTFVLDLEPNVGILRKFPKGKSGADRIELRDAEFHRRVREGFLQTARDEPARVVVLDGKADPDAIHQQILQRKEIRSLLSILSGPS